MLKSVIYGVLYAFLWLGCSPSAEEHPLTFGDSLTLAQNVERLVKKVGVHQDQGPGIAVVVKQAGKILYQHCAGLANLQLQQQITNHSSFYLASLSKQFTATAIMLLEKENKIHFSDSITQYFPLLPSSWKNITIHQLLTHQSGIPDYLNDLKWEVNQITNQAVFTRLTTDGKLLFAPGTKFSYSNSGYVLLALLVEKVTGQFFEAFTQAHIFNPLGLRNTFVLTPGNAPLMGQLMIPGTVRGYYPGGQLNDYHLLTMGDGGIYSSLNDLLVWSDSFIQETLIPKQQRSIVSGNPAVINAEFSYGYGWQLSHIGKFTVFSHGGGLAGFTNSIVIVPDKKLTIILLSNGSYGAPIGELNDQILQYCAHSW